ncbi:MAG: DNA topoisomerase IV subunit B [Mycoplasmataceae bacterium]|nr:DNA topoisomerase IV subunit B [Mycoplasmataceae bacterium]
MSRGYVETDIKVLEGLEPVRKRPGMYIGSTDIHGLHHLIWEIFDNSVDEVISGNADVIKVTLKKDHSVIVEDNGRGIPLGKNATTGLSSIDTVFTVLHAGGKFDDSAYKSSGGLHGVGASVVNALSEWMTVTVKRDGKVTESEYIHGGKIKQPTKVIGTTNRTGTTVHFKADSTIFRSIVFNPTIVKERIRETAFLYKNLKVVFENEIDGETLTFVSQSGISEYVDFINDGKSALNKVAYFEGKSVADGIEVEVALQYTTSSAEIIVSFANSVKTKEGGSHETAFKASLTEVINEYARKWKLLKEKDKNFEGDDVREGLTAVISVRIPEKLISYEGQTKNKLFTQEAYTAIKRVFAPKFTYWLEENKKPAEKIIEKALLARDARVAAKRAREDVKKLKSTGKGALLLSGKLTPAQSKSPEENELFLVEGDSAGGSAKMARDKRHQAILPLRGKVINVEKAKLRDLLANEEICTIISCLGAGIAADFKIEDLKYGKVIIMTDADNDGAHIQVLLLTFFYRFMKPLIENQRVFIALPPLYRITNKNTKAISYAWDDHSLAEEKKHNPNHEIQRYKGLGEMSAEQLRETTMNLESRQLIKVSIEDAALAERRVNVLMGDNAANRKEWIDNNVDFTLEDE